MTKRQNILVMTTECKPDKNCFCQAISEKNFKHSDLHLQEDGKDYNIFAITRLGKQILKSCGINRLDQKISIRPVKLQEVEKMDLDKISRHLDDKVGHLEYWQKIAAECFGCGACTAVCPLCFCFRQETTNNTKGNCRNCISADSCYSESFSEIAGSHNLRPENSDRMYNWYHHKFYRSIKTSDYPLCTGCGRCIDSCPAYLNHHRIISSLAQQPKEKND